MKISYLNGKVIAEAENLKEVRTLLALEVVGEKAKTIGRPKLSHKTMCEICQKSFKSIKMHKTMSHAPSSYGLGATETNI